jgi:hypothetical protein
VSKAVKKKCPLGAKCESCLWYMQMTKQNAAGEMHVEEKCAIVWLPELMIENSRLTHSGTVAVENFRNEMVKGNDALAKVMMLAAGVANEQTRAEESDPRLP